MMDAAIREIGNLVLGLAPGAGPLAVLVALIGLLNRRERRRARLLSLAAQQFSGRVARSDLAIDARCPLLASGGVVRVDLRGPDGAEVRLGIERLRQALPRAVSLVVDGASHPDHAVDLPGGRHVLRARI